jgi:hypothetical protein
VRIAPALVGAAKPPLPAGTAVATSLGVPVAAADVTWIAWARRSQIPGFIALAKTLKRFQQLIWNTLNHSMSNAQSEATNTHLRALTRRSYGFHSPEALIAMAMLTRGGLCPPLPGR